MTFSRLNLSTGRPATLLLYTGGSVTTGPSDSAQMPPNNKEKRALVLITTRTRGCLRRPAPGPDAENSLENSTKTRNSGLRRHLSFQTDITGAPSRIRCSRFDLSPELKVNGAPRECCCRANKGAAGSVRRSRTGAGKTGGSARRFLVFPLPVGANGTRHSSSIKSLDKPEPVKVRRSFGGFWILSRL